MKSLQRVRRPVSLISLLVHGMSAYEQHRGVDVLHVSDLTKEGFCPREYALLGIEGKVKKGMVVQASLRHTFDMGRDIEARVQNDYLGDIAVGDWQCESCHKLKLFRKKPKLTDCQREDITCRWRYHEVRLKWGGTTAGFDLLVDISRSALRLVELKTMIKEEFVKLKAPLLEHRLRTIFYMHMIRQVESVSDLIDTTTATVLYVSKSYGNWDREGTSGMSPFKEYEVKYDKAAILPYIVLAKEFRRWKRKRVLPQPICNTSTCKRAKACTVRSQCFSGKYPAGAKYEEATG